MTAPTKLSIAQRTERINDQRWRWCVWLQGSSTQLDAVKHVVYLLHPSFKEPVRPINDRQTNFKLTSSGWGEFTIRARLFFQDGSEEMLSHRLTLGDSQQHEQPLKKVFLSYGHADSDTAAQISEMLAQRHIEIIDPTSADFKITSSIVETISSRLDEVGAIIVIYGASQSPNVIFEAGLARGLGTPVFVVVAHGADSAVPSSLRGLHYYTNYDRAIGDLERLLSKASSAEE